MKCFNRKMLPKQIGPHDGKIGAFEGQRTCASEHPLHIIKNLFHHRKTRYRGLAKNTAQLSTLFGFVNLGLAGLRFRVR